MFTNVTAAYAARLLAKKSPPSHWKNELMRIAKFSLIRFRMHIAHFKIHISPFAE